VGAAVAAHCLDALIARHEGTEIVADVRDEMTKVRPLMCWLLVVLGWLAVCRGRAGGSSGGPFART